MKISLLHHTPLHVAAGAIRTCWQSQGLSDTTDDMLQGYREEFIADGNYDTLYDVPECGIKDKALIDRVGNKFKHSSTLEHISYNFYIDGISRAVLQELARHRIASLSVKSTRYTLKELKKEDEFTDIDVYGCPYSDEEVKKAWYAKPTVVRASEFLVYTGDVYVDQASIKALESLRGLLFVGTGNDRAKYCLPESYKTSLTWTVNARSLQNFLSLRTSKAALWEIRDLANAIFNALPEEHKYLFEEYLTKENK